MKNGKEVNKMIKCPVEVPYMQVGNVV